MSQHATFIYRLKKKPTHYLLTLVALSLFVGGSVFSSQAFPTQMFKVFEEDKAAVVEYITKTKSQPFNQEDELYYVNRFGPSILDKLKQKEAAQNKQAELFLDALQLQNKSPQLYYNLFLVNREREKGELANSFLKKAQQIDPQLNP